MRVRYEQYFNYVVLCLFTELVKADYNSKFHPSNRDRIKVRYYRNRRVTSPTWGLPPPLVASKNADSLNTMILDFLVDFNTGESRVF